MGRLCRLRNARVAAGSTPSTASALLQRRHGRVSPDADHCRRARRSLVRRLTEAARRTSRAAPPTGASPRIPTALRRAPEAHVYTAAPPRMQERDRLRSRASRRSHLVLSDRPRPGYRDARGRAWPSRKSLGTSAGRLPARQLRCSSADTARQLRCSSADTTVPRSNRPWARAWPMDFCLTIGLRSETVPRGGGEHRGREPRCAVSSHAERGL